MMTREWREEERDGVLYAALRVIKDNGAMEQTPFAPATETTINQWLAEIQGEIARLLAERDAVVQQTNTQVASLRAEEAGLRHLLERVAPQAEGP